MSVSSLHSNKWVWALGLIVVAGLFSGPTAFGKEEAEAKKETKAASSGHSPQTNAFTRFWVHTVGAPMARGMKDGMRKMYKGLRSGSHKIKQGFMSIGGNSEGSKSAGKGHQGVNKDQWVKEGDADYPELRNKGTSDLGEYPGLRAAYKFLRKEGEKTED